MDKKDKFIYGGIISLASILIFASFSRSGDLGIISEEKTSTPKKSYEKAIVLEDKKIIISKKIVNTPKKEQKTDTQKEDKILQDKVLLENKESIIYTSNTKDHRYIIKLISDKKLLREEKAGIRISYIPFHGILEEDNKQYGFRASLDSSYSNSDDTQLYIQTYSMSKKRVLRCDASFLKYLDSGYVYDIKIDINGEYISCYTIGQKQLPKIAMEDFKMHEIKLENLPKELVEKLHLRKDINTTKK